MKEVTYGGGSFVTSDEIAEALLEYAAALGNADRAATVHVPTAGLSPDVTEVTVLVGPSSQLLSEPYDGGETDPDGAAFLSDVGDRIKGLERTAINPSSGSFVDWDIGPHTG